MRTGIVAALATTVLWNATPAAAAGIGVFNDAFGLTCPQAQPFVLTTWYVLAVLAPDACGGITGAEFRIEGMPGAAEGWFAAVNPPPGITDIGDPFGDGARFSFPDCQFSQSGIVVLFTLTVLPFSGTPVVDRPLQILAHRTPTDAQQNCPVLRLCDAPAFSGICVQGTPVRINGFGFCPCQFECLPGACPPLAVEATAWSLVKQLFR